MAEPRSMPGRDPTVPEEATEERDIWSGDEEDARGARREDQQDHSAHPIWPMADDPLRQPGESSPDPAKRRR